MEIKGKLNYNEAYHIHTIAMNEVKEFEEFKYRLGQAIFNTLCDHHHNLARQIRGTELDMFYKSDVESLEILYGSLVGE